MHEKVITDIFIHMKLQSDTGGPLFNDTFGP